MRIVRGKYRFKRSNAWTHTHASQMTAPAAGSVADRRRPVRRWARQGHKRRGHGWQQQHQHAKASHGSLPSQAPSRRAQGSVERRLSAPGIADARGLPSPHSRGAAHHRQIVRAGAPRHAAAAATTRRNWTATSVVLHVAFARAANSRPRPHALRGA